MNGRYNRMGLMAAGPIVINLVVGGASNAMNFPLSTTLY